MSWRDLEPGVYPEDTVAASTPSADLAQISIAISLKRIADALWGNDSKDGATTGIIQLLNGIEQNTRRWS